MLIKVKKNNSCEIIRHRSLIKKNDLETNNTVTKYPHSNNDNNNTNSHHYKLTISIYLKFMEKTILS